MFRPAASVLAWRLLTWPGSIEDSAFLAFAILLLAAHLEREEDRGQWLKELAIWVKDQEFQARISQWRSSLPRWSEWLMGLTDFRCRSRYGAHWLSKFWRARNPPSHAMLPAVYSF